MPAWSLCQRQARALTTVPIRLRLGSQRNARPFGATMLAAAAALDK
jgi:hypothetical protein